MVAPPQSMSYRYFPSLFLERLGYGPFQHRILLAVGLCFASSSMEMLLFSLLAIVLNVEWNLSPSQTDAISGAIFAGGLVGNLVLGPLGDRLGRKPVFNITAAILCVSGLATAVAPGYFWLCACRFAVGFGVGGLAIPFDTLAEFMPVQRRGTHLLFVEYFWTVGTMLVPVLAYICFRDNRRAWRFFCTLCAMPCIMTLVAGWYLVPESPRWLLLQGQHDQALRILRSAALRNQQNPQTVFPLGTVLINDDDDHGHNSGKFLDLFAPKWRSTTLTLWGVWACQYFIYFGAVMAVTLVFVKKDEKDGDTNTSSAGDYNFDFEAIFVSALAETAGTTVVILLIDRIGRIPTQAISYLLGGTAVFVMCSLATDDHPSRASLMVAAFVARLFFMSGTCATWVSTAEVLSTEIRTTGHSTANAIGSISGFFSPYVVSATTPFGTISLVILFLSVATAFFVMHLPETKGKAIGSS